MKKLITLNRGTLLKESYYYTLITFFEKLFPFIITPILSNFSGKETVGLYILFQTIIQILFPLTTLTIDNTILINYYKLKKDEFQLFFTSSINLFLFIFLSISLVLYIIFDNIVNYFNFPPGYLIYFISFIFFKFFTQSIQNLFRLKGLITAYAKFTIGLSFLSNILGISLIIFFNNIWSYVVLGQIFGYLLFFLISIKIFKNWQLYKFSLNTFWVKKIFLISYPVSLHRIGIWLSSASINFLISYRLGVEATASYGVAFIFATIITLFEDSISKAFIPFVFKNLSKKNKVSDSLICKNTIIVYLVIIIFTLVIYSFSFFMLEIIFGFEYSNSKYLLLPLLFSSMFKGFYRIHVNFIFFTKKTSIVTKITFSIGILNLILANFLIIYFGLIGACYSLLISNILQYILILRKSNDLIKLPWHLNFLKIKNG